MRFVFALLCVLLFGCGRRDIVVNAKAGTNDVWTADLKVPDRPCKITVCIVDEYGNEIRYPIFVEGASKDGKVRFRHGE